MLTTDEKVSLAEKTKIMVFQLLNNPFVTIVLSFLLFIHGTIHLMGFLVYCRLIDNIEELVYKKTFFFKIITLTDIEVKIFGLLWLLITILFILISIRLLIKKRLFYIRYSLIVTTLISSAITLLDVETAYIGLLFNIFLLILVFLDLIVSKET